VPALVVAPSEQTYTVRGNGRIQYASGGFTAELEFDPDGYVRHYPAWPPGSSSHDRGVPHAPIGASRTPRS
jgi:Uncharacterized protein conserved in bacteria